MKVTEYKDIDPEDVIASLLNNAKHYVAMSTTLYPSFFNRPKIKEAFLKAFNTVDDFRILLDYNADWETRKTQIPWLVDLETETKLDVRKSSEPLLHWVMIDSKHFRLEKPHESFSAEGIVKTSNLHITNAIKSISDKLQDMFSKWWKDSIIVK